MSRSVSQQQSDLLINESRREESLDQGNDLRDTPQVKKQDSFESNFEASTRGDCTSFEYSDYDEQSCNQSQSFMDETYNPALLAFVEDYILGQRLEILDTCETDDDVASSPSSSFGSETCFSHEEIRTYKRNNINGRGWVPTNNESTKIETQKTTDTVNETATTKRWRWDSLLQSLSAAKRKDSVSDPNNTLISSQRQDVLPAIMSIKETTRMANKADVSTNPVTDDILKESVEKLQRAGAETEKPTQTDNKRNDELVDKLSDEFSALRDECVPNFEVTDDDHVNNVLTDDMEKSILNPADPSIIATRKKPRLLSTESLNMIDDSEVNVSVHSEGIEIPSIPQFTNGPSSPIRSRPDKYFLRGRGRIPRNQTVSAVCIGHCDRTKSELPVVPESLVEPVSHTYDDKQLDPTDIGKPILCSRCRALLSNGSFLSCVEIATPDMGVEHNLSFPIHPTDSSGNNLVNEKQLEKSNENDNNKVEKDASTVENQDTPATEDNAVMEATDSIKESEYCREFSDPILEPATSFFQLDSAKREILVDSPTTNIETTITTGGPLWKTATPTVQIEFKDWMGNDVEIIQESPRKHRSFWTSGITYNAKVKLPTEPESIATVTKNTDEKTDKDEVIEVEQLFPSSASVCNFEVTSCTLEQKIAKSRCFGRESKKLDSARKNVLISPVHVPVSVSEHTDDTVSRGNTECCLESSAVSYTSRVLNEEESCSGKEALAAEPLPSTTSYPVKYDTDEAFVLERAMQQVHAEEKFAFGHSKASRRATSPVTLYRFLDFNPCRNELVQDTSYDFMYDPIGLAVCQVSKADLQTSLMSGKKTAEEAPLVATQQNMTVKGAKSIEQKPSSSLKKVFRRLSKPNKVAFREHVVHVFSKDGDNKQARHAQKELTSYTDAPDAQKSNDGPCGLSETKTEARGQQRNGSKNAAKDKLKALLTEKAKTRRVHVRRSDSMRHESSMSLGSATKMLAAIKAEYVKRRMNNNESQSPIKKANEKKKRNKIQSTLCAVDAALLLQEFKKAQAAGKLSHRNENESPNQEGSDGTIATSGTKRSLISSASRLTIEERKLAHRLLNDIQLLAMIEKKRRSMGQLQSSLKSADINKSVQLLKSIEASRKNRISKEADSKIPSTVDQEAMTASKKLTKTEEGASMLADKTSAKKVNN